ncbi:MAG: hypothetical protein AAGJ18_04360 [Bacteroidota bacterium]
MKNTVLLTLVLFIFGAFASCVSSEKYKELVQVREYLEAENQRLKNEDQESQTLRAQNRQPQLELEQARAKVVELQSSFNSLNRNYQDLTSRYNNLVNANKQIGSADATNKQYWEEKLAKQQLEIEDQERQMQTLRYTLEQKEKRVQELLQMLRSKQGN